jgi:hypothetical protein
MGYRVLILVSLIMRAAAQSECPYPCWTEIGVRNFIFESFPFEPEPRAFSPYEFSLPYPSQNEGGWSHNCDLAENPNVDLYQYTAQTQTWIGPLTGPVYRNPSYLEVSGLGNGRKGLAVRVLYSGSVPAASGNTLVESVFFHTDRCYHASTEFGFSHAVRGLPTDNQISFYNELNANCQPTGKCRVHGTDENLIDQRVNMPVTIPAAPNSQGGSDWLYEAYLINGGSQWRIRVVDPYNFAEQTAPVDYNVSSFFLDVAQNYWANGATGYVTATSTRNGPLALSQERPVMNVVKIVVAK